MASYMETLNRSVSSCRFCQAYCPDGRREGMCNTLGVSVNSQWQACALAVAVFTKPVEEVDRLVILEKSLSLELPKKPEKQDSSLPEAV